MDLGCQPKSIKCFSISGCAGLYGPKGRIYGLRNLNLQRPISGDMSWKRDQEVHNDDWQQDDNQPTQPAQGGWKRGIGGGRQRAAGQHRRRRFEHDQDRLVRLPFGCACRLCRAGSLDARANEKSGQGRLEDRR